MPCLPTVIAMVGVAALSVSCAASAGPATTRAPAADAQPAVSPAATALPPSPSPVPIPKPSPALPAPQPTPAMPAATLQPGSLPPTATGTPTTLSPGQRNAVGAATKDLAQRSGVTPADIRVVSVTEVDWPDTSLGCPKPGMAYAQVMTAGYRIVLGAGSRRYEYHSDHAGRVVTCD